MNRVCSRYPSLLFILLAPYILFFSVSSAADSVIVEKNLFSPDREKWTMEPYKRKDKEEQVKRGKIDDIILSGTVVSDKVKSAVLSESSKKKKEKSSIYLEGDYISGYLLKKINKKNVVLEDVSLGEEYVVFLNDGKKSRSTVKTEIKDDSLQRKTDKGLKKQRGAKIKQAMAGEPAEKSLRMKNSLKNSLDRLEKNKSRFDLKKAENDLRKLKKLYPQMSREEKKEVGDLGKKLESLKINK
jgi:hypothetical protein